MDDPIFASAHELATAIQNREVSSAEVVDAHLAQIDRHNARLNAVVTLDEDGARERAQEAGRHPGGGRQPGTTFRPADPGPPLGRRAATGDRRAPLGGYVWISTPTRLLELVS